MRVFFKSCQHTHAILPDILFPYSRYSLLFVLLVPDEHFARIRAVDQLCGRFLITTLQLYKWVPCGKRIGNSGSGSLKVLKSVTWYFFGSSSSGNPTVHYPCALFSRHLIPSCSSHRNPVLKFPENTQ